ncbi:unnamed protein product [Chondrus crispus]|uniref:Uncharacterized protein n=1 Tax=Chondrus crispus TaxID=2769 RepID=R7QRH9_CHOCR|nr:unnamed protein product [Chondrus crispus]CDF40091.1 unnamed protein product [Chondrus crispus]|eukprot:XP_005710385.1 unnamed protein product [Chondrus crispus]
MYNLRLLRAGTVPCWRSVRKTRGIFQTRVYFTSSEFVGKWKKTTRYSTDNVTVSVQTSLSLISVGPTACSSGTVMPTASPIETNTLLVRAFPFLLLPAHASTLSAPPPPTPATQSPVIATPVSHRP